MVFMTARTYYDPGNSQSGFAEIGAGVQTTGDVSQINYPQPDIELAPERPTKGLFSFLFPGNSRAAQTGMPEPENALQHRPPGSMYEHPAVDGGVTYNETPNYSRGAGAFVPNTGKLFTNPIGAGVVAMQRPQASYGPSGQYVDHQIWWTSQAVPTTVPLNGLLSAQQIADLIGEMHVEGVVRVG